MSQRTPPDIVQASDEPEVALTAFIAQDLESWTCRCKVCRALVYNNTESRDDHLSRKGCHL